MTKQNFTINGETENLWELVVSQGKSLSQSVCDEMIANAKEVYREDGTVLKLNPLTARERKQFAAMKKAVDEYVSTGVFVYTEKRKISSLLLRYLDSVISCVGLVRARKHNEDCSTLYCRIEELENELMEEYPQDND